MRLINADKLIETLRKDIKDLGNRPDSLTKTIAIKAAEFFMQDIANIGITPTAYDVDKVVKELEKCADESYKAYCINYNSDDRAEYDAYINAIEIVKAGDVNNDI